MLRKILNFKFIKIQNETKIPVSRNGILNKKFSELSSKLSTKMFQIIENYIKYIMKKVEICFFFNFEIDMLLNKIVVFVVICPL